YCTHTAPTPIYTLSLHDALPILGELRKRRTAAEPDFFSSLRQRREAFSAWEQSSTQFKSNNEVFDEALLTAVGDFHALQIPEGRDRKSTRLNSSHVKISYAVFCL